MCVQSISYSKLKYLSFFSHGGFLSTQGGRDVKYPIYHGGASFRINSLFPHNQLHAQKPQSFHPLPSFLPTISTPHPQPHPAISLSMSLISLTPSHWSNPKRSSFVTPELISLFRAGRYNVNYGNESNPCMAGWELGE